MDEVLGKLTAEQYYRWRFVMEEMLHAETKTKMARMQHSAMEKDVELLKMRTALYKHVTKDVEDSAKLKKEQYNKVREELEACAGTALDENIVIDDVTFEIKKLV